MIKYILSESQKRFDELFDGWDTEVHYTKKNNKIPDLLSYYIKTETGLTLPYDERSPHVSISENHITIYSQYPNTGIVYSGGWLSNEIIRMILQVNFKKLDIILNRRCFKRLEWKLLWIDNDKSLTDEQKSSEKIILKQDMDDMKKLLDMINTIENEVHIKNKGKKHHKYNNKNKKYVNKKRILKVSE